MKVVITTIGKFHHFDLARQLYKRQALTAIFTGYPRFKLKGEGLPTELIQSFPWLQTFYMFKGRMGLKSERFDKSVAWWSNQLLDTYVARKIPDCDLFIGISNTSLKTSRVVHRRGGLFVCDRPISHIRYQDQLLRDEFLRHKVPFLGEDPRFIAKEEAEYAEADKVTVGSSYARRSFLEQGFPPEKIQCIPYGVDLSRFHPAGQPDADSFDVLFVGSASLRKGIPYLLESFARLSHPRKRLTLVGTVRPEVQPMIAKYAANLPINCAGHQPQDQLKEIMSRSHVMVLPSIDEGLAMVQAQAMACGCPVIGTTNSGAEDLFEDGVEGFIVPIRDSTAITERLEALANSPALRTCMSARALARVKQMGGWDAYGQAMIDMFEQLLERRAKLPSVEFSGTERTKL